MLNHLKRWWPMYFSSTVTFGLISLTKPASPKPAGPPPVFENLGMIDGTTWVKHDPVRHVTCWEFYYEHVYGAVQASAGGISCLPDSELYAGELPKE